MTEQSQRALDRNDDHVAEATERVAPIVARTTRGTFHLQLGQ